MLRSNPDVRQACGGLTRRDPPDQPASVAMLIRSEVILDALLTVFDIKGIAEMKDMERRTNGLRPRTPVQNDECVVLQQALDQTST